MRLLGSKYAKNAFAARAQSLWELTVPQSPSCIWGEERSEGRGEEDREERAPGTA